MAGSRRSQQERRGETASPFKAREVGNAPFPDFCEAQEVGKASFPDFWEVQKSGNVAVPDF
jgi:hypothetical protein